ncbi:MAG TPA: HEAT repeat domain-containing protein, partial [Terriglobales bacterium]|nr:HEAT repeat domain-containing protein [Terriglobales bacterium]
MSFGWRATSLLIIFCLSAISIFTFAEEAKQDPREQAWQILRTGLEEKKAPERAVAVQALSLLPGNRRATTFAITALHDKNAEVRTAAAVVLGQQHARSAVSELKQALTDSEITVVLAAAHSLLLLKDPAAYDVYYAVLIG